MWLAARCSTPLTRPAHPPAVRPGCVCLQAARTRLAARMAAEWVFRVDGEPVPPEVLHGDGAGSAAGAAAVCDDGDGNGCYVHVEGSRRLVERPLQRQQRIKAELAAGTEESGEVEWGPGEGV